MSDAVPPNRVFLLGMMGAGKTTIGTALSLRTGWDYLDNDELLARATGESTPHLLADRGEQVLRDAESAALTEALSIPPPVIAACAGGIVGRPADRERLARGGFVVYLRATLDTLVARVGAGEGRPWLQPDPRTALTRLFEGRGPLYEQVASLVVDVDAGDVDAVVDEIIEALREQPSEAPGSAG